MAVYSTLTLGATLLGGPVMGGVSDRWGARAGLAVAGIATGAAAVLAALVVRRGRPIVADDVVLAESAQLAAETST